MKKTFLVAASAAMLAMPLAAPASADAAAGCTAGVIVHENPKVSTNPVFVETGEYEPYSDCPEYLHQLLGFCIVATDPSICF
jgi:hypothetical protein